MTEKEVNDKTQEFEQEEDLNSEVEFEAAKESPHPGWQPLTKVYDFTDPFFENIHFFLSYEYSSNVYLLKGDYITIVDPGNDYTSYLELFRQGYKPTDIKKIVLTHGHRDHCMGAFELLRAYPSLAAGGGFELILHEAGPVELKKIVTHLGSKVTEIQGGERLSLSGQEWEAIYTPGHSLDGMTYYHAPSRTAITGDTTMPYANPEADRGSGGNLNHYLYAIRTLLKRDIAHILPGHGVPVANLGRTIIEQTYESLLLQILGAGPESKIPWTSGAEALARQGLLEEAVFCCNRALAINPGNMRALQIKAFCLTDLGRGEEAIEALDQILAHHPNDPHTLTAKGHALLGLGRYEESLPFFDEALRIYPILQEAQIYKGMALYLAGRMEEAMNLDAFRIEFSQRLKAEMEKLEQEKAK
jgi:glyoxylase-like metal-dependent hydrolase (beta-lactamase superfamily II)|uniref:MBL fold metallo-hydrolase n=1 Tax=Desulfobacca acetoxidans TaxID=60893 RepID=A0A7C3WMN6_9BACT